MTHDTDVDVYCNVVKKNTVFHPNSQGKPSNYFWGNTKTLAFTNGAFPWDSVQKPESAQRTQCGYFEQSELLLHLGPWALGTH